MKSTFIATRGADLQQVQTETKRAFDELGLAAATRLLPDTTIGTDITLVAHGLEAVPRGWRLYSLGGDARVWQVQAPDAVYLYLQASAEVTTGIEVF